MINSALKEKIISHYIANPGVSPHYTTLGTNYKDGSKAYDELLTSGQLVWRKVPSKTGRMIKKIFAS